MKQTRAKLHIRLAAFFLLALSAAGGFPSAALPYSSRAAAPSSFDDTTIEDDLQGIDLSEYPKNLNAGHRLLTDSGFMELGFSQAGSEHYGLYFYLYNPTEAPISTTEGMNVVNMAVIYSPAGIPTDFANRALTVLSRTSDHRFYKFKLTDPDKAYKNAQSYSATHAGERRYDVSGIQVLFSDRGFEVSDRHDGTDDFSRTYFCSGYAKGFGADPNAESSLKIRVTEAERVNLDLSHTFYRSQTSAAGSAHQNQLDTVYFSVSDELFEKYGKLQRIKAEWYEYKTKPILVSADPDKSPLLDKMLGRVLPDLFDKTAWEELKPLLSDDEYKKLYQWTLGKPAGQTWGNGLGNTLYWLFRANDGASFGSYDPYADAPEDLGGVASNRLEEYLYAYDKSFRSGKIKIGNREISADLFEEDIDDSRKVSNDAGRIKKGYSFYDFDVDVDLQEMSSWKDGEHSDFVEWFYKTFGIYPTEESRVFAPIYILKAEDLVGSDEAIADKLMIQSSAVPDLKRRFLLARNIGEQIILFRFAVTDYEIYSPYRSDPSAAWSPYTFYDSCARQSVFLDFDVIQLSFHRDGELKVIPVVADPIDLINPVTPKPGIDTEANGFWHWLGDLVVRVFSGDLQWWEWFVVVLIVLALLLLIPLVIQLFPIIVMILKGVVWILILPFRLTAKAMKTASQRRKKSKKHKQEKSHEKFQEEDDYQDKSA